MHGANKPPKHAKVSAPTLLDTRPISTSSPDETTMNVKAQRYSPCNFNMQDGPTMCKTTSSWASFILNDISLQHSCTTRPTCPMRKHTHNEKTANRTVEAESTCEAHFAPECPAVTQRRASADSRPSSVWNAWLHCRCYLRSLFRTGACSLGESYSSHWTMWLH